ncbi:hypothetical protein GCM10027030_32380 [Luteococcus sediminum]
MGLTEGLAVTLAEALAVAPALGGWDGLGDAGAELTDPLTEGEAAVVTVTDALPGAAVGSTCAQLVRPARETRPSRAAPRRRWAGVSVTSLLEGLGSG